MFRFINWPPLKKWIKDVSHVVISFHLLRNTQKTSFPRSFVSSRKQRLKSCVLQYWKPIPYKYKLNSSPPIGQPILNANKTQQKREKCTKTEDSTEVPECKKLLEDYETETTHKDQLHTQHVSERQNQVKHTKYKSLLSLRWYYWPLPSVVNVTLTPASSKVIWATINTWKS